MKMIDMEFDTFFKYFIQMYIVFLILLFLDCVRIKISKKNKIE
jgi:hypothetical protein